MKKNKKGFTLAELLVVVAIIGILVAVSIPVFTSQLKKARLATNQANARAAKAEAIAAVLDNETVVGLTPTDADNWTFNYDVSTGKGTTSTGTTVVAGEPSTWTTTTANASDKVFDYWTVTYTKGVISYAGTKK